MQECKVLFTPFSVLLVCGQTCAGLTVIRTCHNKLEEGSSNHFFHNR